MDKETLMRRLNEDLAGELGAIIQNVTYAAKVTGPCGPHPAGLAPLIIKGPPGRTGS